MVHVAGGFNSWLEPKGTQINPTHEEAKKYRLNKKDGPGGGVVWEREISIAPGSYDFKFVMDGNHWIHWHENSEYPRGNDAPGGPNFHMRVAPSQAPDEQIKEKE